MNVLGVIQARLSSTRLPGKVLLPLAGRPVLSHVIQRLRAARTIDDIVVATSSESSDDELAEWCSNSAVLCVRGPLDDVLMRFCIAIRDTGATTVVRVPSDKPFVEPEIVDVAVTAHLAAGSDYTSNMGPGWPTNDPCPIGMEIEVAAAAALLCANDASCTVADREHVMPYLYRREHGFRTLYVETKNPFAPLKPRLTLDTPEDYEVISTLYDALATPDGSIIALERVRAYLQQHPNVLAKNSAVEQRARPR